MQKKNKKQKTFDKQMLLATIPANLIAAATVFIYGLITMQLSLTFLMPALKLLIPLVAFAQFVVAPFIDGLFTKPIAKQITAFENGELDERKRTELVEMIMHYPIQNFYKVIGFFFTCAIALCTMYKVVLNLQPVTNIMAFVGYLFGSYFAGVLGYNCAFNNSSPIAMKVVEQGVNYKYVKNKKTLGTSSRKLLILFVAVPAVIAIAVCFIIFLLTFFPYSPDYYLAIKQEALRRVLLMTLINIVIEVVCVLLFYTKIWKKNEQMVKILEQMNAGNVNTASLLKTDIGDEFSYNFYLTNQILLFFRDILHKSEDIGNKINNYAKELVKVSSETQSTVVEQSTGVREIVSTMEDANRLAHNIELSINDVTDNAEKTASDVEEGSKMLTSNLEEIQHIEHINEETIKGIMELNERIGSIWEVVNIINNIADQTKIIAFNAELEATSVVKTDFKNVSMEIRRLANTTMDSTKEIKQRINEIQEAANSLIQSSQATTDKIQKGADLILSLEERFANIKDSTQENASSANEIKMLVNQQTAAFEQIVNTLHQISSGIENFSISTRTILETSHLLEKNAENLSTITTSDIIMPEETNKPKTLIQSAISDIKRDKEVREEIRKDIRNELLEDFKENIPEKIDFVKKIEETITPETAVKELSENKPKGLLARASALAKDSSN